MTTTDTNVLVRLFVEDDPTQSQAARQFVNIADQVVIPTPALCELVWVLRAQYGLSRQVIIAAIEALTQIEGVIMDASVVDVGLEMMRAGGDFADGVIAADGRARGGDVFVSFDRKAVNRLRDLGVASRLLAGG